MKSKFSIKKLFGAAFLVCTLMISTALVSAQEETTKSAIKTSPTLINSEKVQELKEKLATKVAQLRESQRRGYFGEIASISKTTFTLVTPTGEVRIRYGDDVTILDLTSKKAEKGVSDLKNTMTGSVLGFYDKNTEQHQAKIILLQTLPTHLDGEVTQIDKVEGTFSLKTGQNELVTVEYERTTKAEEYSPTEGKLKKSGLSRITVGDRLHVWTRNSSDGKEKFMAGSLLRLPQELFGQKVKGDTTSSPSAQPKGAASPTLKSTPATSSKTNPKTTSTP